MHFTALLVLVAGAGLASGFYLPGVAPRAYETGEVLPLLVNRLDSTESIVPYDYFHFDFCERDNKEGTAVSENLGQILLGERIRHSPYEIRMEQDVHCKPLCQPKVYSTQHKNNVTKFKLLQSAIKKDYIHHWILDNLPVVECTSNCRGGLRPEDRPYYRLGFPVGCDIGKAAESLTVCTVSNIQNLYPEETFINNHIDFTIKIHRSSEFTGARIVGIEAKPRSYAHASMDKLSCEPTAEPQPFKLEKDKPLSVIYTYSVVFQESPIKWASRWDTYLQSAESTRIHWFSIVNSLVIVVFLSGLVGVITVRALHKDISRYNSAENQDEAQEEFGWKLVHGDVFRPPPGGMLLSVCLGTGTQILLMFIVTMFFACLGFLSPATRGGLMTCLLALWVLLSSVSGYISARFYKMFGGEQWKSNVLLSSFLFPGVAYTVFFVLNLVMWANESSAAVPFGTLVALMLLWFGISVPLTFFGAYYGFKKEVIDQPVRTNQIPRQIPPQSIYTQTIPALLMGGVLPFGCIFIQLFFLLNSIWGHKLYYVFGFLLIVFGILIVTTIESTILLCYFHLCTENYHWWWRAFLTGGASSLYLFGYAILFYFRRMEVDGTTNLVLYVGYTSLATMLFWLATGTAGFYGCFAFIRKIYSSIKVD
eukprot:m.482144 g.482144  ORF g.482144 m.482144 type:complete len:649 (-) comp22435_c0_seq1:210-2156(-)